MRSRLILIAALVALGCQTLTASAEEMVYATGRVFSSDGRTPLPGALVAVYDSKNHVIDYTRTDERGEYALAVPRHALNLQGKGGKGFFRQVMGLAGGVGRVATLPLKAGIRAAAAVSTVADPLTKIGIGAASGVAQGLVDQMAPRGRKTPVLERNQPGVLVMKVTRPGHNDVLSLARVYWLEEEQYRAGGKQQRSLAAWVDPVQLSAAGDEKPSTITSTFLTFTEARFEPSIAEVGQKVSLVVKLPTPPDPSTPTVVIARHCKTGEIYQLEPEGDGIYRADIQVIKKFPKNDQGFCVVAYAEQDDKPGRNKKVEDAICGSGLLNPEKPYIYNPLLVASRNRADVMLTVVDSRRK
jgi:hypothetical protein